MLPCLKGLSASSGQFNPHNMSSYTHTRALPGRALAAKLAFAHLMGSCPPPVAPPPPHST
eukprot:scaffold8531_cov130-Isochrysis_galbana.AAC.12